MSNTNFPTSIDTATNPTGTSPLNSPDHAGQHGFENDAILALETKVGVDSSAVTTTLDYKLKNTSSVDPGHKHTTGSLSVSGLTSSQLLRVNSGGTAIESSGKIVPTGAIVGDTDSQTLTNKTISDASNTIQIGTKPVTSATPTSGQALVYDGSKWTTQSVAANKFGGTGADGALSITSGTTTIDCGNAAVVVKNYTSISITGTGKLAFSNPNTNGTIVILRSQGDVTLTSSTAPMIDMSGMGGQGGSAVTATTTTNGNDGNAGYGINYKTNLGTKGSNGTAGSGGAICSGFVFQLLTTYLKYFNLFVGAGAGSGDVYVASGSNSGTSGKGGSGGGCLIIECGGAWNFTTANGISVAGQNGGNGTTTGGNTCTGGGGGGGGGYCLVLYNTLTANTGTINVSKGTGGNTATDGSNAGYGGGGGGSFLNAGSSGSNSIANGAKVGGDGGDGSSLVQANTQYS